MNETLKNILILHDDDFIENICGNDILLNQLDTFFQDASKVQIQKALKIKQDLPVTGVSILTHLVFLLYMRTCEKVKTGTTKAENSLLLNTFLHPARIIPFCQIYVLSNRESICNLIQTCISKVDGFSSHLERAREIYIKEFNRIHALLLSNTSINTASIILQLYELLFSINVITCIGDQKCTWIELFLDLNELHESNRLLKCFVSCYEHDLPKLIHIHKQSVGSCDIQLNHAIGKTRVLLLEIMSNIICTHMSQKSKPNQADMVVSFIHSLRMLSNGEAEVEEGSLLSDLWNLYRLHDKFVEYSKTTDIGPDHIAYLEKIINEVRKRTLVDSVKSLSTHVKEEDKQNVSNMVKLVKDLFPDVENELVEQLLKSHMMNVEDVIHALLEGNLSENMTNSNLYVNTNHIDGVITEKSTETHSTKAWKGKKPQLAKYDPKGLSDDPILSEKMKSILHDYDDGEEKAAYFEELDGLYDDEYDDNLEDYQPFSVNDDRLGDLDEIREQNKRVRAREAEEIFWENMRNPNHLPVEEGSDEKGQNVKKDPVEVAPQVIATDKKSTQPDLRQRARDRKNKAKIGNHHRKDRAMRKQNRG